MCKKDLPEEITEILPSPICAGVMRLHPEERALIEEVRMRRGCRPAVLLPDGERVLEGRGVTEEDLREVLSRATNASAHTSLSQMKNGFVTLKGGHRIGVCGTATCMDDGAIRMRYFSSMAIRIARAVSDLADKLLPDLFKDVHLLNTLIIGAPGTGKTTLLRDIVRVLSDGVFTAPMRIGVADERGEIAAMWKGLPQFYVGRQTDIIEGCSKAQGLSILLRAMNPQVLAVDEITHPDDIAAIKEVVGCGVALIATAHGGDLEDLFGRSIYREMLEGGIFQRAVILRSSGGVRSTEVKKIEC